MSLLRFTYDTLRSTHVRSDLDLILHGRPIEYFAAHISVIEPTEEEWTLPDHYLDEPGEIWTYAPPTREPLITVVTI